VSAVLLAVALVWGWSYPAGKSLITPSTLLAVLAARLGVAAVVTAAVMARRLRGWSGREARTGMALGLVLAGALTGEAYGLTETSATRAALIISTTMVLTPLLEHALNASAPPAGVLASAGMAIAGTALLTGGEPGGVGLGDMALLAGAALHAVHVVLMSRRSDGRPGESARLTATQFAVAATACALVAGHGSTSVLHVAHGWSLIDWLVAAYLSVAVTVFAFFAQMWAVHRTSPTSVCLLLGTEPVWAAAFGLLFLSERLTPVAAGGAVCLVAGTAAGRYVERRRRRSHSRPDVRVGRPPLDGPAVCSGAAHR
jgi:drug/metabolite transporter (DMT)-like permease